VLCSKGTGYPFLPCAEKATGIHYYPGYFSLKKADRAFPYETIIKDK
jgi:hypothetical protein